jgi:two-component system repressor protein LuxO
MQAVYKLIESAAASSATVFVTGESGTGKEVCAESLHRLSKRRTGPFIAVNCAAIPHDLLESELFGHVKGAFTGATCDRKGAALQANGGTLFLDEIGDMAPAFQAKMLRFLQTGKVQRVGENGTHNVDVRIVCATNRNPKADVGAGRFREDLYYRLHVIPIELPPLRDREDDVLLLAHAFLGRYSSDDGKDFRGLPPGAEAALLRHGWPGNVRELQNLIRRVVVLNEGPILEASMLGLEADTGVTAMRSKLAPLPETAEAAVGSLDDIVDRAIQEAIDRCGGSIPKAALALKVSASTIYRRRNAGSGAVDAINIVANCSAQPAVCAVTSTERTEGRAGTGVAACHSGTARQVARQAPGYNSEKSAPLRQYKHFRSANVRK